MREDVDRVHALRAATLDAARPEAVADGLITGTGQVAGQSCAILAYDYTSMRARKA